MQSPRLRRAATALVALVLPVSAFAFPNPQTPIAGSTIPQFAQPLPLLSVQPGGKIDTLVTNTPANGPLQLSMCEFKAQVLPPPMPASWVWGYIPGATCPSPTTVRDTYIGPVLVNTRDTPTTIRWTNALPTVDVTNLLAYKYSTDQTLHWSDPLGATPPSMASMGPEGNMCHMASGDPPQVGVGIPAYRSNECSLNFGEWFNTTLGVGGFNHIGIPAVPHLHGGEVPPVIDGGPDAWFTSDGLVKGHDYYTNPNYVVAGNEAVYSYPNGQGAAPLWFHDHTLGATRLNVYAGLAGGYYILDPAQEAHFQTIKMRPVTEVVPIVLQDRMFDVNGQLYFPNNFPGGINGPPPNPQHPYWNPEFIGDTIVINGKAWPYLTVEPRRYRFLFLNGSNARAYEMFFVNQATKVMGPPIYVIGNDDGFLDAPAVIDPNAVKPAQNRLVLQPGERYEVIIDFSKFAGQNLVIKNVAKAPYPAGAAPQGTTTGQLMQFRVLTGTFNDTSYDPTSGVALRPTKVVRLAAAGAPAAGVVVSKTRELTLNEVALLPQTAIDPATGVLTAYPGGPVEILVNNSLWAGTNRSDFKAVKIGNITEFVSEFPGEGTTELWEIVNTTMDAHPIHTHLASFQIVNRQNFDQKAFMAAYGLAFPGNGTAACLPGVYCGGFGPPLNYDPALNALSGGKFGGNPDVTPYLQGPIRLPDATESGWKDTFITYPGMVNRFIVRWGPQETAAATQGVGYPFSPNDGTPTATDPTGVQSSHGYVWHCHIIDHEDNEMMRPDVIAPLPLVRSYVKGLSY
jgi:FtsP/CotA-like multicopper oxidase with cupredoxin domain